MSSKSWKRGPITDPVIKAFNNAGNLKLKTMGDLGNLNTETAYRKFAILYHPDKKGQFQNERLAYFSELSGLLGIKPEYQIGTNIPTEASVNRVIAEVFGRVKQYRDAHNARKQRGNANERIANGTLSETIEDKTAEKTIEKKNTEEAIKPLKTKTRGPRKPKTKGGVQKPKQQQKNKKRKSPKSSTLARPAGGKVQLAREEERRKAAIEKERQRERLEKLIAKERKREKRLYTKPKDKKMKKKASQRKRSTRGVRKQRSARAPKRFANVNAPTFSFNRGGLTSAQLSDLYKGKDLDRFKGRYNKKNRIKKENALDAAYMKQAYLYNDGKLVSLRQKDPKGVVIDKLKKWNNL